MFRILPKLKMTAICRSDTQINRKGLIIINSELKDRMNEIRNIENKYGLVLFRMGLSHLCDVGHRHLGDDEVESGVKQIMAQGKEDEANGKIPIMMPEFLCEVIRCAAELTNFTVWTLFAYIKEHVVVGTEADKYLLLNCFERKIGIPEPYDSIEEAQSAMKSALIEAMDGVDDSVFADYNEGDDYGLELSEAWFSHRHGNHDWKILTQTSAGRFQYA
jgi:hypothetical protein